MTTQPARRPTADSSDQQAAANFETAVTPATSDIVARRCARDRAARQRHEAAVEQLIAARLDAMPEASTELHRQIAECRQRRATDTCPGRCVITGRPRPQL